MNIMMRTLIAGLVLACCTTANADIIGDITTDKGPNFVGPDSNVGNGDFETDMTTGTQQFASISNWHNLAGPETVNFGQSNGTNGSPQSGSLGAQLFQTIYAANDTGFVIPAGTNNVFSVELYLGQFGNQGNYDAATTAVTAHLFTSTTGVTGTTVVGDTTDLATVTFSPFTNTGSSAFFNMVTDDFATIGPANAGDTVYLGFTLADAGNNVFPRIDVVSLAVATTAVPEPSSLGLLSLFGLGVLRRKRA